MQHLLFNSTYHHDINKLILLFTFMNIKEIINICNINYNISNEATSK